jgi:hypothetical protein
VTLAQHDAAARDAILARLAQSRAEISRLLEPPAAGAEVGSTPNGLPGGFPRSRTMQALMSGRGLGALGAIASGVVLARPALAWRLVRLLPTGAVARAILARIVRSVGTGAKPRPSSRAAPGSPSAGTGASPGTGGSPGAGTSPRGSA